MVSVADSVTCLPRASARFACRCHCATVRAGAPHSSKGPGADGHGGQQKKRPVALCQEAQRHQPHEDGQPEEPGRLQARPTRVIAVCAGRHGTGHYGCISVYFHPQRLFHSRTTSAATGASIGRRSASHARWIMATESTEQHGKIKPGRRVRFTHRQLLLRPGAHLMRDAEFKTIANRVRAYCARCLRMKSAARCTASFEARSSAKVRTSASRKSKPRPTPG